jgi:hypothetical protein
MQAARILIKAVFKDSWPYAHNGQLVASCFLRKLKRREK